MLFLISIIIAASVAFFLAKPLKKHPVVFYVTAALLTVFSIAADQSGADMGSFMEDYVLAVLTRGALGTAFWALVMWAGALPNGSYAIKRLMPIRGELSITAAILTLSHVITYGMKYISDIARDRMGTGSAYRDFVIVGIAAVIMVMIMLPLTVMSFKTVRKRMDPKKWKKIQRTAYVFYGLIYVHLMIIFVPKAQDGRDGYFLNVLVYTAVFAGYAAMRFRKAYVANRKTEAKTAPNVVCACAMIVPLCTIGFMSRNTNRTETIKATKDNPATFVFEVPQSQTAATATTVPVSTFAVSVTTAAISAETVTTSFSETTTAPDTSSSSAITIVTEAAEPETSDITLTTEPITEAPTEAQPVYRYKNGTFEGTGEGYSGTVHVSITIENDYITAISAYADDDDPDYFSDAMQYIIPQIQSSLSADADACSGATYSSKGIIEAAKNALEQAIN